MSVDALSASQWRDIAHAWRRLGALQPADFDGLRDGIADEIGALMGADWVALLVATLDAEPEGDPLSGWRLQLVESPGVSQPMLTSMDEAMRRGLYLHDKRSRLLSSGAGRTRVVLRRDGEATGDQMRRWLDDWGVADHLMGVLPLTPEVELYLSVARSAGRPSFEEPDRHLLLAALEGLRGAALHLARSHGLLGPVRLTPRQRQCVALLLRGLSEKELAAALGISLSTAHEHVVEAYRKLNVRSRPELLNLWLSTGN